MGSPRNPVRDPALRRVLVNLCRVCREADGTMVKVAGLYVHKGRCEVEALARVKASIAALQEPA
jgi:hypothetical protein